MAYIGRDTDKISNVEVLDNITFNGSSSYTLQKGGSNFIPSSANTLLVSIDGVVQAGNFTVSGSTIDFGTAVAATSTCDFILHYGTGLITTPADGTVTTAKIGSNAVTTAKIADANVTSAKMFSGFKNGITITDQWRLTADIANTDGVITSNLERVDDGAFGYIGTGMTESSGIFSFPSTGLYLIHATMESVSQTDAVILNLQISVDNFSNALTEGSITQGDGDNHATNFASGSKIIFFNVTNTSTHKARFNIGSAVASTVRGNSSLNETCFTFIRLGDSV